MAKKSQKDAVIEEVTNKLPAFTLGQDIALTMLSHDQLEDVKANIFHGIITGNIEYGKDPANHSEARTYARSMVMNWLKKAKELNGGYIYRPNTAAAGTNPAGSVERVSVTKLVIPTAPVGVKVEALTPYLQEYVKSLV